MITTKDIEALAPLFRVIDCPDKEPSVFFERLAGALLWTDELPDLKPSRWWNIRPVLTYRTSLAVGNPYPEYQELWDTAKRCFPEWVGFRPKRCVWDDIVMEVYKTRVRAVTRGY